MTLKRGMFIVFEGGDRSGKTSQICLLQKRLELEEQNVKIIKFPNRDSKTGKLIDSYLKSSDDAGSINDQTIHLLFSANRWEMKQEIEETLRAGTTILVDRYSYSGIAYSSAKGLDLDWCIGCDRGLPTPDLVFYFSLLPEKASQRGDYGAERYERVEFQEKVARKFSDLFSVVDNCLVVDADREIEAIADHVYALLQERLPLLNLADGSVSLTLWV